MKVDSQNLMLSLVQLSTKDDGDPLFHGAIRHYPTYQASPQPTL
jgi:hypothetical protein